MNISNYVVFDFETDGVNPLECQPLQIAAVVINPRNLEIYSEGKFHSYIKPDFATLQTQALEINKIEIKDLEEAPNAKTVWKNFATFVSKYDVIDGKTKRKPIPVGYNIQNFDLPIVKRLNDAYYNKKDLFNRFSVDVLDISFMWFENNPLLPNLKFDSMRQFFGLSTEGAHNAIVDVEQTAQVFVNFIRLHRNLTKVIHWGKIK